jgi:hypothetical protein
MSRALALLLGLALGGCGTSLCSPWALAQHSPEFFVVRDVLTTCRGVVYGPPVANVLLRCDNGAEWIWSYEQLKERRR